jgi:3-isopropylmalate/(R)-2-methylmalate dehydratase small subunit
VTFAGLELHVFEDDRAQLRARSEQHAFDAVERRDARVLVAGANFGCGSSREHAPQALQRWGIRAIVAESFAEIFAGNALMIGLPCVTVAQKDADALRAAIDADAAAEIVVDLRAGRVTTGAIDVEATDAGSDTIRPAVGTLGRDRVVAGELRGSAASYVEDSLPFSVFDMKVVKQV